MSPGRIQLLPHVEDLALAAAADLCVLPTRRDPCGLANLEALACGTPVVTTSRAGAAEVMQDPTCGTVLEDPEDLQGLGKALENWLDRLAEASPDRETIRASVKDRDLAPWMESMEKVPEEAAREG